MAKSKHAKPDEFQKEINRYLKKELQKRDQEIKHLRKQLGYNQNKFVKTDIDEQENMCQECEKGITKELEVVGRIFIICQLCGHRTKKK